MSNKFSIIVPVYNKADTIARTLQSLVSQTYDNNNYEVIIIDDGSTDESRAVIKGFMKYKNFRAFFLNDNSGRMVARNMGMRMARNDWICWLDADDEYMSTYLEVYNENIERYPDFKLFNSGMLVKDREIVDDKMYENGYRIIPPFNFERDVRSGDIGSGSFVFHKDIRWFFPEGATSASGLEDSYPYKLVAFDKKFEEICKQNENGHYLPLGNPWGDDISYFWYLTRNNKAKMINSLLYIQHVRR